MALALLFAVYKTRSTPFYILDEIEAALDDTNLRRLLAYLDSIRDNTQFIMITHQRRTMEMADVLYGISMQSDGVTKVMSQRLGSGAAPCGRITNVRTSKGGHVLARARASPSA